MPLRSAPWYGKHRAEELKERNAYFTLIDSAVKKNPIPSMCPTHGVALAAMFEESSEDD